VDNRPSDLELTFTTNADALWEAFEQTGSMEAFLRFIQKAKLSDELVLADLHS
jgi:hypothetical protein